MITTTAESSVMMILTQHTFRTKWKRQTAVGIELLQEASNVAALQQMYRTMGISWPPGPMSPHPLPASLPSSATSPVVSPFSSLDLYYRQAAAAHSLQRPFPYKMMPGSGQVSSGTPLPPSHPSSLLPTLSHLPHSPLAPLSLPTASSLLQEMSNEAMKSSSSPPHSPISVSQPQSVSPHQPASPSSPDSPN